MEGTWDITHSSRPVCAGKSSQLDEGTGLHLKAKEQSHCLQTDCIKSHCRILKLTHQHQQDLDFFNFTESHKANQKRSICKSDQILIKRQYKIFMKKFTEVHAIWFRIKKHSTWSIWGGVINNLNAQTPAKWESPALKLITCTKWGKSYLCRPVKRQLLNLPCWV